MQIDDACFCHRGSAREIDDDLCLGRCGCDINDGRHELCRSVPDEISSDDEQMPAPHDLVHDFVIGRGY